MDLTVVTLHFLEVGVKRPRGLMVSITLFMIQWIGGHKHNNGILEVCLHVQSIGPPLSK